MQKSALLFSFIKQRAGSSAFLRGRKSSFNVFDPHLLGDILIKTKYQSVLQKCQTYQIIQT